MSQTTTACSRDFSLGCASTLTVLCCRRGRLLSATFVAAAIAPSLGYETTPAPAWFADLSPAERAILSPRYTGGPAADAAPPPVAAAPPTLSAEEQQDAEELWFFDLTGHLLVRGKSQGVD